MSEPTRRRLRLVVLSPHFAPDTAPTGVVMTRIVHELAARGHELHVVTSLPWYRRHAIEPGWDGRWVRTERTPWGSVVRVHPFPGGDKRNLARRALGFVGFSALAGAAAAVAGGRPRRVDAVIAMSPPLTLGVTGWGVGVLRRGPLVFNVQDVFPDAAIETGAVTNPLVVRVARWLERVTYRASAAVTVLSDDLRDNVAAKLPPSRRADVHVIPNFVDVEAIRPQPRWTAYRQELGLGDGPVVLYAGNVGWSQSLELVVHAARSLPDVTFLVNGDGAARPGLEEAGRGIPNLRFADFQPAERLAEVLATGDVHVVPLRRGLGRVSVPSKTYSILAAGRPVLAAVDPGTEVTRLLAASGAGLAVPPDDPEAFVDGLRRLLAEPGWAAERGARGRAFVEGAVSPAAVAEQYEQLILGLGRRPRRRWSR